jgi:hypothetical protein
VSPPGEVGHLLRGHLVGIVQNRHALRQTVIGMITGSCLAEHENPGEATILILHRRVRLSTADLSWDGARGETC